MLTLPAPAKLNLFLHITGRRDDGYHELQTVFQFITLHDVITLTTRPDQQINRLTDCPGLPQEEDLLVKAARALSAYGGVTTGVDISIDKNIPMGAGLGGGSSDAATVLCGLNQLWNLHLSNTELASIGLKLGADVPVFVHGHAAWAEGTGNILTSIDPPENHYLLIVPPVHVSTAKIFAHPALTRDSSPIRIADFLEGHGHNDLEVVVRKEYPEVDKTINWLQQYANARMTGTGAGIFISVKSAQAGQDIARKAPPDWRCFITQGLNSSPLHDQLSRFTNGV
ncbi:MAG: 4-(cytidine 5'-diphospho)-2-C-methyl-D-erythritol kinase [Gammaproteobacteria bacterium]|nr:4-(cytidine 5'-diphospho)-2-C-methyl-D-erythritol kinase [Gammaproteobacteria bacterium]